MELIGHGHRIMAMRMLVMGLNIFREIIVAVVLDEMMIGVSGLVFFIAEPVNPLNLMGSMGVHTDGRAVSGIRPASRFDLLKITHEGLDSLAVFALTATIVMTRA